MHISSSVNSGQVDQVFENLPQGVVLLTGAASKPDRFGSLDPAMLDHVADLTHLAGSAFASGSGWSPDAAVEGTC